MTKRQVIDQQIARINTKLQHTIKSSISLRANGEDGLIAIRLFREVSCGQDIKTLIRCTQTKAIGFLDAFEAGMDVMDVSKPTITNNTDGKGFECSGPVRMVCENGL